MAKQAVSIDLGSHQKKLLVAELGKGGLAVRRYLTFEGEEALAAPGISTNGAVVGLAGRDMVLRYSQVPPSPDWQLKNLMDLEIQDLAAQSGGELSADYNVLPIADEDSGMETVLMALARNDALARMTGIVQASGGSVGAFVPNCIAIYNAYLKCGPIEDDTVVCLCNLGHETIDIALVKGTDLLFARNLSGGAKVFDDAIAGAFNVSERKAEQLKRDLLDLDPGSRGKYASGQAEKVTMAAGGAASMIVSAIQSSVAFCQSQTKIQGLRLDKVLLSGGASALRGLTGFLRESLRCTVELYDPFSSCDLSALPPEEVNALERNKGSAVIALGLAAGRLDDSLYSLEILPEAVRRKKRFLDRTIWSIAAGVIGVAVLGVAAYAAKQRVEKAEIAARQITVKKNALRRTDDEAVRLADDNAKKRELVAALAERAVPLDGAIQTLRALRATLPTELWVQQIEVVKDPGQGQRGPRQVVQVTGAGKEVGGSEIGTLYQDFNRKFRKLIPLEDKDIKASPMPDGRYAFTFRIDFQREPARDQKDQKK